MYTVEMALFCSLKVDIFEKVCRRATRDEITFHCLAVLRAAHAASLYTLNLLLAPPMYRHIGSRP